MKIFIFFLLLLVLTPGAMPLNKFPQADISNGIIQAKIYLPDAKKGYYQGTRFDWSGNMPELKFKGHNYFGQWFSKYDPQIHDAIMGPVEEFTSMDFIEAKPGESFLKIGVGILEKPDDKPYSFERLYKILNYGKWTVNTMPDQIKFLHELNDTDYSYEYEKIIQLVKDKPDLVLHHTLKNTGSRTIETSVYDHNFFVIDKQPVGPGYEIIFPYNVTGSGKGISELAKFDGNKIVFIRNMKEDETVYCGGIEGFTDSARDYDIRIENRIAGAGVRITSDQPLLKLVFWSCATTTCPEPYIKLKIEPGQEFSWKIFYSFYTLDKK